MAGVDIMGFRIFNRPYNHHRPLTINSWDLGSKMEVVYYLKQKSVYDPI